MWLRSQAKLPLTIDQYHLLLQALKGGFGLSSRKDLKQICRLLWVKPQSTDRSQRFEEYFDLYFDRLDFLLQKEQQKTQIKTDIKTTETKTKTNFDSSSTSTASKAIDTSKTSSSNKEQIPTKTTENNLDSSSKSTDSNPIDSSKSTHKQTQAETKTTKIETDFDSSSKSVSSQFDTQKKSRSNKKEQTPIAFQGKFFDDRFSDRSPFSLTVKNLPVSDRQIQHNWRYLRRPIREGAPTEVDLDATVRQISEEGIFLEPVLIPSRVNRTELVLLIDSSNSMDPFNLISQKLVETAKKEYLARLAIYYFRNCPRNHLYLHPNRPDNLLISNLLPKLHRERTVILIFSDAGAARGGINRQRIEMTFNFLQRFNCVRQIVWLNPLSQLRWRNTTAEWISEDVKMFEFSQTGFLAAIRSIKG